MSASRVKLPTETLPRTMTAFALSLEKRKLLEELTEVHIAPLFALALPFTPNDPP